MPYYNESDDVMMAFGGIMILTGMIVVMTVVLVWWLI